MKTRFISIEQAEKLLKKADSIRVVFSDDTPYRQEEYMSKAKVMKFLKVNEKTIQLSGDNARKIFKMGIAVQPSIGKHIGKTCFIETDEEELYDFDPVNFKNFGTFRTVGELFDFIKDYPADTSFGFRNQPLQNVTEIELNGKKMLAFQQDEQSEFSLVSGELLLSDLLDEQEEVVAMNGLRFQGVHEEKIKQIFEKHRIKYKEPF